MNISNILNSTQTAVSSALTQAMNSSNPRMVAVAAAGAAVGVACVLAYEYGSAAVEGISGAADAAVEGISKTVCSWFTSAPKADPDAQIVYVTDKGNAFLATKEEADEIFDYVPSSL